MPPFNAPSWKELATRHANEDAEFGAPANESEINGVEQALGVRLPELLSELLLEADGVTADYGSGIVWSVAEIQKRNLEYRSLESFRDLYMPFNHLLFFGDDGGGDQFAFAIQADGKINKADVFRWEHETDARAWFAGRLEQYIEKRLKKEDDDDEG